MEGFLGFFEMGAVILMWMIFWNWFVKGLIARYSDQPWAQGLGALLHA